jgi:hypothetical protein
MHRFVGYLLHGTVVLSLALLASCASRAPVVSALEPPHAVGGSLITVQGSDKDAAAVIWDAGLPTERKIPTTLGGSVFSVPKDATAGIHPVALENTAGRSTPMNFVVDAGAPLQPGTPRIDHIMVLDAQFTGTDVTSTLYVQGANVDIGAVVEIGEEPDVDTGAEGSDPIEVATVTHQAIVGETYGVSDANLGYPIHQYVAVFATPGSRRAGGKLLVAVKNPDGVKSPIVTYTMPTSSTTLDSDGDSLLDDWEIAGYDADGDGTIDTDRYRRDIFVELDIMQGLNNPIGPTVPNGMDPIIAVRDMFAAAPFMNPYVNNGINLVVDASGTVPAFDTVIFDRAGVTGNPADGVTSVAFSTLKANHFDHTMLGDMYHYVIWAKRKLGIGTGESDFPSALPGHEPGDDALISMDGKTSTFQTKRSRAEILAHELGHNLGQRHGGENDAPYTPNYWSVMSYAWALRTGAMVNERRQWVTCLPFYYAKSGETEGPLHQVPATVNMVVDYSAGMAKQVNEYVLDETTGVCGHVVDWDQDGTIGEASTSACTSGACDANDNGTLDEKLDDFANWPALRFDGPKKNGTIP